MRQRRHRCKQRTASSFPRIIVEKTGDYPVSASSRPEKVFALTYKTRISENWTRWLETTVLEASGAHIAMHMHTYTTGILVRYLSPRRDLLSGSSEY